VPTYVILYNLTEQGIKSAKSAPPRIRGLTERLESRGGKLLGWYLLMGQYDAIAIVQVPNDEALAGAMLALGAEGNVRTVTSRAFTIDEFEKIASALP
jgi:uncharacterized protein with GYD domain